MLDFNKIQKTKIILKETKKSSKTIIAKKCCNPRHITLWITIVISHIFFCD